VLRPFSNRVLKEYDVCERTPLSVEIVPCPPLRLPSQTADADLLMSSLDCAGLRENEGNLAPHVVKTTSFAKFCGFIKTYAIQISV
jgi:hypothetical protein